MALGITLEFSILRNFIEIFLFCFLFLMLDKPRFSWKKIILFYAIFLIFHTVIGTLWVLYEPASYEKYCTVSIVLWSILFFYSMSKTTIFQVLYNIALQVFVLLFGIFISVRIAQIFFHSNPWIDILFRILYFIVVVILYYRYLRKSYLSVLSYRGIHWAMLALVALLGDIIVIYYGMIPRHVMVRTVREQIIAVGITCLLFITNIYMLQTIFLVEEERKVKEKLKYSMMNNAFLKKEFALIEESVQETKRIQHDIKHHNKMIAEFARKKDMENLFLYLQELDKENCFVHYCNNHTINSILIIYIQRAKREKIAVTTKIEIKQEIKIRDIDLTSILGNALENAIHGCILSEKPLKEIKIVIYTKGKKLVIIVENTCKEDSICFIDGMPKSKSREGIGTYSMKKSVDFYHGDIDFRCKNGNFLCRILVTLPS